MCVKAIASQTWDIFFWDTVYMQRNIAVATSKVLIITNFFYFTILAKVGLPKYCAVFIIGYSIS